MTYVNHVIRVCNCNIAIANLNKLGTLEGIRYVWTRFVILAQAMNGLRPKKPKTMNL